MDIVRTIAVLEIITPVIKHIPVGGTELGMMLELAVQACRSAQNARAHRDAYKQLAQDIAVYAAAVSRAAQSNQRLLSVALGQAEGLDLEFESWTRDIRELSKFVHPISLFFFLVYDAELTRPAVLFAEW